MRHQNLGDGRVFLGAQNIFHFHGFHHGQCLARFHGLPLFNIDADQHARHWAHQCLIRRRIRFFRHIGGQFLRASAAYGQFNARTATSKAEPLGSHINAHAGRSGIDISVEKQIPRFPTALNLYQLCVHAHAIWRALGFKNPLVKLHDQFVGCVNRVALQNLVGLRCAGGHFGVHETGNRGKVLAALVGYFRTRKPFGKFLINKRRG